MCIVNFIFSAMEFHVNDSVRILVRIGFCLSCKETTSELGALF